MRFNADCKMRCQHSPLLEASEDDDDSDDDDDDGDGDASSSNTDEMFD